MQYLKEKNSSMALRTWLLSSCFSRYCKHSSNTDSSKPLGKKFNQAKLLQQYINFVLLWVSDNINTFLSHLLGSE